MNCNVIFYSDNLKGYSPPGKKKSKCDDAPAMTLVVQWWFFVPFGTLGSHS